MGTQLGVHDRHKHLTIDEDHAVYGAATACVGSSAARMGRCLTSGFDQSRTRCCAVHRGSWGYCFHRASCASFRNRETNVSTKHACGQMKCSMTQIPRSCEV